MLEIDDLSLAVPMQNTLTQAVSHVSLTIKPGRVMGLVGESGCGKTLTAQSILRLGEYQGITKVSGDIRLHNESIFSMSEKQLRKMRGGKIAMIFQEPMTALNPVFSIASQMLEVIGLHLNLNRRDARLHAIQLLEDVGLQDAQYLLQQYPDALSGGMRQRVLIAMAMSANPEYIIADEPTTALDVSVQKRIIALLRKLQQEKNLGMLLVTHDFGLVAEMCDDVVVMYAGEVVERGAVMDIFNHPAHPYTQALMGCRPEVAKGNQALTVIEGQVPMPGEWPIGCRFAERCPHSQADCQQSPVAVDAWRQGEHIARCVHISIHTQKASEEGV
ncbi:MAG: ABC transporter ATP-binding protein [Mariprofundaceae bacterium]|nr:ABC transporter ATP-binding protein [Mariprofundaceae bacterium]